uniref:Uncharacterized protein n=1 Tax=Rhizophora mucronata TaxID=61149 RepID=A0A2P2N732_RHIMU
MVNSLLLWFKTTEVHMTSNKPAKQKIPPSTLIQRTFPTSRSLLNNLLISKQLAKFCS